MLVFSRDTIIHIARDHHNLCYLLRKKIEL